MTTKPGREEITRDSLESLIENTSMEYRLTVYVDGVGHGMSFDRVADHVIYSKETEGLGPAINRCLAHIDATNRYFQASGDPRADSVAHDRAAIASVSQFVCYCQDDLAYSEGWLERLVRTFALYEDQYRLGFASGLECVEHATTKVLGGGMLLKRWIRAAQMFGRRSYWMSMWPIPRFDPETGRVRARPNDGVGSGVDWHLIRNHPNSVDRTGRQCLVIPGLVRHIGFQSSTWLDRELPESVSDREAMKR